MNKRYDKFKEEKPKKVLVENSYETDTRKSFVISHLKLRKIIGILGFFLPIVLILGSAINNASWLPSISDYYHSTMKIIFTGILFTIATFFWTSKGESLAENTLNNIAAICASLVALLPTPNNVEHIFDTNQTYTVSQLTGFECFSIEKKPYVGVLHFVSAGIFFICLILLVLCFFLKREKMFIEKNSYRIWGYRVTGWGMVISICFVILFKIYPVTWPSTFIFETTALWCFGFAWIIKSNDHEELLIHKQ